MRCTTKIATNQFGQYFWRTSSVGALVLFSSSVFVSSVAAQSYKISGHVTDGFSNSIAGATVQVSGSQTASTSTDAGGNYSFSNLQAGGTYNLHATMPGNTVTFTRTISNLNSDIIADLQVLFFVSFHILVKDGGGAGIPTVGIRINVDPYIFAQTNSFGVVNISVGVPITGNGPPARFTPDKDGYVFLPPSATVSTQNGDQSLSFTGVISNAAPIELLVEDSSPANQAAALDAAQLTRDPFPLIRSNGVAGNDNNTRVTVFATNLQLAQGETASAIIVILKSGNISAEIFAEDVRAAPGSSFTQIVFRLPNQTATGTYSLQLKAHGQTSNAGAIRIVN